MLRSFQLFCPAMPESPLNQRPKRLLLSHATGCSFLAFAVLAAKQGLTSTDYPTKGFYYLGGLTEATETIMVFVLMCLLPAWFPLLAYIFAGLCLLTTATRIAAGIQVFNSD